MLVTVHSADVLKVWVFGDFQSPRLSPGEHRIQPIEASHLGRYWLYPTSPLGPSSLPSQGSAQSPSPQSVARPRTAKLPPRPPLLPGPVFDRAVAAQHHPDLTNYLNRLEAAYEAKEAPEVEDAAYLGALIEGLNLAEPGLHLEHHTFPLWKPDGSSSFARRLEEGLRHPGSWHAVLDDEVAHRSALSVRHASGTHDVSLLLVDSLTDLPGTSTQMRVQWSAALDKIAADIQSRLSADAPPLRLHLNFIRSGTQKTDEGCCIFALSAIKKMNSDPAIRALHDQAFADLQTKAAHMSINQLAPQQLPPSLLKHSTAPITSAAYVKAVDDPAVTDRPVNKKGLTLVKRVDLYLTERAISGVSRIYSTSYEAKRIDLIRSTLAQLIKPKQLAHSAEPPASP